MTASSWFRWVVGEGWLPDPRLALHLFTVYAVECIAGYVAVGAGPCPHIGQLRWLPPLHFVGHLPYG